MAPKINWHKAVNIAIEKYGLRTEPSLQNAFLRAHVSYPPKEITFLAFKKEKKMELWAKQDNQWRWIKNYKLTAFSGALGPKLKEHDKQIPEGIYNLTMLNPFSKFHLSIQIDYPNSFDRSIARLERRRHLGGNIFLHGKNVSVGCLAVGDRAIDQIFLIVNRVGLENSTLIIAPNDMRVAPAATHLIGKPKWVTLLYKKIKVALQPFRHAKA
ncbi:murein L,D-transpeptidase family protein [Legionella sp. W05-934-2]|jgi:murein L,D-transpeptidase YafK|uniref:L,D-transpeptidase family protein n=1 Tax=Legionella sp. W05-934-2 TaxID=1198649 RepID=UPI003462B2EA